MDESKLGPADHERTDVSARIIWLGAPTVVAGVLGLALLVLKIYPAGTVDSTLTSPPRAYPEPQLQTDPVADMQALRAAQLERLNGASWVDKERGVVHRPIEAAMRDLAQRQIADWPHASEPVR